MEWHVVSWAVRICTLSIQYNVNVNGQRISLFPLLQLLSFWLFKCQLSFTYTGWFCFHLWQTCKEPQKISEQTTLLWIGFPLLLENIKYPNNERRISSPGKSWNSAVSLKTWKMQKSLQNLMFQHIFLFSVYCTPCQGQTKSAKKPSIWSLEWRKWRLLLKKQNIPGIFFKILGNPGIL